MRKNKILFASLLLSLTCFSTACQSGNATEQDAATTDTDQTTQTETAVENEPEAEPVVVPEYQTVDYAVEFLDTIESETIKGLEEPCDQKGTVVTLDYEAPAYAVQEITGQEETLNKAVSVYLPYGYDDTQQYNVLYLLHGTGGDNEYWLQGRKTGEPTCNVLDNMIKNGLCDPMIVVTPDYYADVKADDVDLSDEVIVEYGEKVGDSFLQVKNDVWPEFFGYELRNQIIPLIETTYSTYAGGDVSDESLIATRDHRGMAGLSRGAMANARSGLMKNVDVISYFGSFSGVWAGFEKFKETLTAGDLAQYPVNYWYNGNGTADFSAENHINFHNLVMEQMSDKFVDGENYALVVKEGAEHSYENWITDLYNTLLVFFK